MLKVSELAIGDWILHDGKYKEVITIWPHSVSLYDSSQTWGSIYADNHAESEIEPIPLTPEILEKNFESNDNDFGYQNYRLNADFIIENRGDRFCLVRFVNGYRYASTFFVCNINYVHQLQQVLKLLSIDIDKEIVL